MFRAAENFTRSFESAANLIADYERFEPFSSAIFNPLKEMEDFTKSFKSTESLIADYERFESLGNAASGSLKHMENFTRSFETTESLIADYERFEPLVSTTLKQLHAIDIKHINRTLRLVNNFATPLLHMSRALPHILPHTNQINNLVKTFEPMLSSLHEMENVISSAGLDIGALIKETDFSSIVLTADGVCCDGEPVSPKKLIAELDNDIAEVKECVRNDPTNVEKIRKFCQRIFQHKSLPVVLVIFLSLFPAMYPDEMRRIGEAISQPTASTVGAETYAFTINERTILRDSPNGNAHELAELSIETRLRVISSVPRWHEVEYITVDGETIIGWVSKRSADIFIDWFSALPRMQASQTSEQSTAFDHSSLCPKEQETLSCPR